MKAKNHSHLRALSLHLMMVLMATMAAGCQSFFNSWFDPTQMGDFGRETTAQIRTSLSIQDTPTGIPGAEDPLPEDLIPVYEEYVVGPGDVLSVRIFELLARNTETTAQAVVDEIGTVSLPVLGQMRVAGMTRTEITQELIDLLAERGIIQEATVVVEIPVKRNQIFLVFGATPSANLYPLPRPNTRLLEALNIAGGLLDAVTELYIIRQEPVSSPGAAVGSAGMRGAAWMSNPRRPYRNPRRPYSLSDGYGVSDGPATGSANSHGTSGSDPADAGADTGSPQTGDRKAPPGNANTNSVEESQLLDAATPLEAKTGADKALPSDESTQPEPVGQPRWIFVNGEWISTTVPDDASPDSTASPAADTPVIMPSPPSLPGDAGSVSPPPDAIAQIDWDRLSGETQSRVIRISVDGLRAGDYRQNIIVRQGDIIRVIAGQVGEYYIMGQVGRPGAYSITGREVTLKTAIASAGNLAPLAWPSRCTIYRRYGDREEMHQVNLDAIFAGKESDLMLKNYDLILVGTHPVAPFLAVFRNAFRLTYGFGFVYDRNFADIDSYGGKINPSSRPRGFGSRFPNLFN